MLSLFPRDVLDGTWDLIESVSEGFLTNVFNDVSITGTAPLNRCEHFKE